MRDHLRTLQATCLDRGFYRGRAFELKTSRPEDAAMFTAKAEEAQQESEAALAAIMEEYNSLKELELL